MISMHLFSRYWIIYTGIVVMPHENQLQSCHIDKSSLLLYIDLTQYVIKRFLHTILNDFNLRLIDSNIIKSGLETLKLMTSSTQNQIGCFHCILIARVNVYSIEVSCIAYTVLHNILVTGCNARNIVQQIHFSLRH